MSDIGLSYDATTEPSQFGVTFSLSMSGSTLQATVREVQPFIVRLTPSGNVPETIVSGIAWPLAQFLGTVLPTMTKSLVNGFTFEAMKMTPSTVTMEGESLTFSPQDLQMSGFGGMLLLQGSVQVS